MNVARMKALLPTFILTVLIQTSLGGDNDLTFISMQLTEDPQHARVCFRDMNDEDNSGGEVVQDDVLLACHVNGHENPVHSDNFEDKKDGTYCSEHAITTTIESGDEINCILTIQRDSKSKALGHAKFIWPDDFPKLDSAQAFEWEDLNLVSITASLTETFNEAEVEPEPIYSVTGSNMYFLFPTSKAVNDLLVRAFTSVNNTYFDDPTDLLIYTPDMQFSSITMLPSSENSKHTAELQYCGERSSGVPNFYVAYDEPTTALGKTHDLLFITAGESIDQMVTDEYPDFAIEDPASNLDEATQFTYLLSTMQENGVIQWASGVMIDRNLNLDPLSGTTIEMKWDAKILKEYIISRDGDEDSFNTASVKCPDSDDVCYGYFVELTPGGTYMCLLKNKDDLEVNSDTTTTLSERKDFEINKLNLKWKNAASVDAIFCFDRANTSIHHQLSTYELIMINTFGQVQKIRGASKTLDGSLCFGKIFISTEEYDITGKMIVVVVRRDANSYAPLESGETQVHFIAPKVEGVSGKFGRLSWSNPGGYTFTIKKQHHHTPLATNLTCNTCNYHFTLGHEDNNKNLIVETENSPVRLSAQVTTFPTGASGM